MDIAKEVLNIAKAAKKASQTLSVLSTSLKNQVLNQIADELSNNTDYLKRENEKDIDDAHKKGLSAALIDRLSLNDKVIKGMIEGIREVVQLTDAVGETVRMWRRPNNLLVGKVSIPLGVIGIIYESRPNVTVDAASLCLKSGNEVILRGGKE